MDFSDWLLKELEVRGWTNSELARRANVVPSTISMIISGAAKPGPDACRGIASAFGEDPVKVFRLAGLFPSLGTRQDLLNEAMNLFDQLNKEDQGRVIIILRALGMTKNNSRQAQNVAVPSD